MPRVKKEIPRWLTDQELLNPTPDLDYDAVAYGRQSTRKQVVNNVESHRAQTVELLKQMREKLEYRDDGTTGKVTLRIENQIAKDGKILNASGAWPIDRRPNLKATLEDVENDRIKLIAVDTIDRLFRDEDQIDSNIFLKACKEHGCYIYVVATGMLYNLANDMHMMLIRQLLQIAAHYLKTLKETTGRRKKQARNAGKYAGYGPLNMGYVRDSNKTSKNYGKIILYPPHAEQGKWLYKRIVELNFNVTELAKEVSRKDYLFEPFPNLELEGHRKAKKLPNGGYTLTRSGLRSWLTNETNIGVHYTDDGERIEDNHEALVDKPTYYLVCSHIKPVREQPGVEHIRNENHPTRDKSLLSQVMTSTVIEHPKIRFITPNGKRYLYGLHFDDGFTRELITTIEASTLDSIVTNELFKNIKTSNLQLLKDYIRQKEEARLKRLNEISQRLKEIDIQQEGAIDEISKEAGKLKEAGLETSKYLEALRAKYDRLSSQAEQLEAEKAELKQTNNSLGTLEDELENLQEMWPDISIGLKKQLISEVIQNIFITPLSPMFVAASIVWAYDNWSAKTYLIRRPCSVKEWTPEEEAILKQMYPDQGTSKTQILEALPYRSWAAIYVKVHKLDIPCTRTCNMRNKLAYRCLSDIKVAEELNIDVIGRDIQEIPNDFINRVEIRLNCRCVVSQKLHRSCSAATAWLT
jgi:DNA invertase Pin-like site-specific DNA recombinase